MFSILVVLDSAAQSCFCPSFERRVCCMTHLSLLLVLVDSNTEARDGRSTELLNIVLLTPYLTVSLCMSSTVNSIMLYTSCFLRFLVPITGIQLIHCSLWPYPLARREAQAEGLRARVLIPTGAQCNIYIYIYIYIYIHFQCLRGRRPC